MNTKRWALSIALFLVASVVVTADDTVMRRVVTTTHLRQHTTPRAFWESVAVLPITVTFAKDTRIEWQFDDPKEVQLGSFEIDAATDLPGDFWQHPEGTFLALYCREHKVLYSLARLNKPSLLSRSD